MSYRRVTGEDRLRIKNSLDAGLTKSAITDKLGFDKSIVGREIKRNSGLRGLRPKKVNKRKKLGHWKRDTLLGKDRKACVLVITDRKSRFNKFRKLRSQLAPNVTKETIAAIKGLPVKSITNDRGQEFSDPS
jgi:IS30 family transposase